MRNDLDNRTLQLFYPMYPYELAAVATTWYGAQLFKAGYLEMAYNSALFQNSPQYLHNSYFKRNADFLVEVWDWSCQNDELNLGGYFKDMKYTLEDGKSSMTEEDLKEFEELNVSIAKLYLASLRMTMGLAQHYVDLFSIDGEFTHISAREMFIKLDFDVTKENPFIELIKTLGSGFNARALLFAFLTTCPSGEKKVLVDVSEATEAFDLMSPFSNLSNLYDTNTLQNYINMIDWMNV